MKKQTLFLLAGLFLCLAEVQAQADLRKKIELTSFAERSLVPDEIILSITLREYKNGNRIVEMNRLEEGLVKALRKLDIDQDKLSVDNIYGYNWDWRKKRPDDFLASKGFYLQVPDLKKINDLVEELDPEGVQAIRIAELRHSREDAIRQELAQEALQKARDKAAQMLEAIGEELGGVLEISSFDQSPVRTMNLRQQAMKMEASDSYSSDVDFRNLDIRVEIRAVFQIK